ncbi:MAG: serine/threonine protein kinase [Deltaproteobacteria bacterium]|nr:serine/threonine protein kinase [Deltaproteobacteria bacterium]
MASRQLEKYKLLEEVGHGGMAIVYRGLDTALNREVAVKILHPHLADQDESKQRFQREAQAVAKLRHDNILEIYDYSGLESADSYIVTEFIHGQTLKAFLSRSPISHPEIAVMVIVEVCNALEHAHSLGIIHRDIKPENIMIRKDGRVKLTDFGIAQIVDVARLTVTGQLLGSPAYMAPELVEGKPLDFRSDVYSVGTLLYQLATGELPFKGKNPHEVLKRIAEGKFIDADIVNPVVGTRLGRVIRRALAHDPDQRYASVQQLRDELLAFLADVGIESARDELARYFGAPPEYSRELQHRVVTALTAHGKAALSAGRTPHALQYFDRVLCTDPRNAEVLALLDQVSRRRRIGRTLAVLGLVGALGGGAYAVSRRWPASSQTALAEDGSAGPAADASRAVHPLRALVPKAASDTGGGPSSVAAATHALDARPDGPLGKGPASATVTRVIRALPPPRRIEIIPTPKAMSILLNGKLLGLYGPDLRELTIPRGAVTLTFRNDACCFEKVLTIGPQQNPRELHVRLPWKPGRVRVNVSPHVAADVVVGSTVGQAGQELPVPIPSYADNGRTEVQVRVSAAGYPTVSRSVVARANHTTDLTIELRKTP